MTGETLYCLPTNAVLSGYITTLKNKQKLDVSSEGPSSRIICTTSRSILNDLEHIIYMAFQTNIKTN
jgi:hypothetical protein